MSRKSSPATDYATRRKRKSALAAAITSIEMIAIAEEAYRDNIPDNLLTDERYDTIDDYLCALDEAVELLRSVYN